MSRKSARGIDSTFEGSISQLGLLRLTFLADLTFGNGNDASTADLFFFIDVIVE